MKKRLLMFIALFSLIVGVVLSSGGSNMFVAGDGVIEWNSVSGEELI